MIRFRKWLNKKNKRNVMVTKEMIYNYGSSLGLSEKEIRMVDVLLRIRS